MDIFKLIGRIVLDNQDAKEGLDEVTDNAKKTKNKLNDVDDSSRKLSKGGFTVLKGAASKLVADGFQKVISAVGKLVSSAVDYQKSLEQYTTSFEVMTGSAEKAAEITERLAEIAAITPFGLNDVASATQLLINYGIEADDAVEKMMMLGDISQGSSDKLNRVATAYGQMSSAGKVLLQDVKQMIEAGFNPLQEISNTTGESMESLYDRISNGTISVDEITAAMERATSEGGQYFNSMVAQSETLSGRLSTLKDTANESIGNILSGLLQKAADEWIPALTDAVSGIDEKFQVFAEKFVTAKEYALSLWEAYKDNLAPILEDLSIAWEAVKDAVQPVIQKFEEWITSGEAAGDIFSSITTHAENLSTAYENVKSFIGDVVQGFQDAVTWGQEHETILSLIAVAVVTVVTAILAYNTASAIMDAGGIARIVWMAAMRLQFTASTVALAAHTAATWLANTATTAFSVALNFLTSPITLVIVAIGALIAIIVVCVKHWDEIEEKVIEVWNSITEWVSNAVSKVKEKFNEMKEAISEKVNAIRSGVSEKFTSIKNAMANTMQAAKDVVSEKLANMKAAYEEHGGGIKGVAAAAMEGIKGFYTAGYDFIDNLTGGKLTAIKEKFGSILGSARDKVREIIESIKGLFNFSWSLPKLKLPHFSFSGKFSLNPLSVPKLSVNWYAKGGVLDSPTIFGVNGNSLMGGGEAGKEAVAPINVLQGYVADAVASQNTGIAEALERMAATLDAILGAVRDVDMDGMTIDLNRREFGRLVRAVT